MKTNCMEKRHLFALPAGRRWVRSGLYLPLFFGLYALLLGGCRDKKDDIGAYPVIQMPQGFKIEKVAQGLNLPTSVTWDNDGNMYVVESGGGLEPETLAPLRIMQIKDGKATVVVDLAGKGIKNSIVGLVWYDGAFYITHRADDLTGAVSRVTKSGQVTTVFQGIIDSQAEHQINDIRVGPDGRMYVAVGPAGNAGVADLSILPWIMKSPNLHTTPYQDIVLLGNNFKTPDPRTPVTTDTVLTGAFLPFGTPSTPGQVIKGTKLPGGSILSFDPKNAMGTIETYAWGFRNLNGLAWNMKTGAMYGAENGYDIRGSRPVKDVMDASLRIEKGKWYGVPDYSAGREPLTDPKFEVPDDLQAMVVLNGRPQGKNLGFLIDHKASGLTPPTPAVVLGRHEVDSSPSQIDVAPDSWGDMAGRVFVTEWGDLAPPTNPLLKKPVGSQVVVIDPATGKLEPFVRNLQPGPASGQGQTGAGIERPYGLRFGPDGAMYIVDYGVVTIDMQRKPPYAYQPGTGVVWKVSKQ